MTLSSFYKFEHFKIGDCCKCDIIYFLLTLNFVQSLAIGLTTAVGVIALHHVEIVSRPGIEPATTQHQSTMEIIAQELKMKKLNVMFRPVQVDKDFFCLQSKATLKTYFITTIVTSLRGWMLKLLGFVLTVLP